MENKSIHCTLTDAQLITKADQWIDELIGSGGKSWTMQVPARPNADTDLILAETVNRFKALMAKCERYETALKEVRQLTQKGYPIRVLICIDEALSEGEGQKEVDLYCMVCGTKFMGPEPKMCCSGRDCGCMGLPTEPIVCSKECYENLPVKKYQQKRGLL